MQNYCFEKKIKRAIAGLLFLLFVFGAVLINLPTAWAQEPSSSQEDFGDAQAAAPSQTASDAPSDTASAEPTAEPSGGQEPAPSAAPSSEVPPSESQEPAPSSSAEEQQPAPSPSAEEQEPAPSPSAEEQEPSPSPSESGVIFEHVPEIIIPVPRTILYSNISGFPASYQDKLRALQDRYPDWVFTPVITNLNWDTVIAEESKSNKCTIQQSVDEALRDPAPGTYDPGWQKASKQADAYFIDPRNFLTPTRIFQFEQLAFNASVHTQQGVEGVMKGTFMENKLISYYDAQGTLYQTDKLYSRAVIEAGYVSGVSPYYIVSKIRQEIGVSGDSPSISGKYPGYEGLYNFFNIGASDGDDNIARGLAYAKGGSAGLTSYSRPWTDPMKSITGGAQNIAGRYISKGQNTVYYQRFNVSPEASYAHYTHQYMTNVAGAAAEAYNTYTAYESVGQMGLRKEFLIPVYNNMPDLNTSITINTATHRGICTGSGVNVRTGPATSYASVGTRLNSGERVEILGGYRNDTGYTTSWLTYPYWVKVRFTQNGRTYEGYVHTEYIQPDTERNISKGQSFQLSYTVGNSEKVYFDSGNPSVATVSESGVVTAVSPGTAIIRAYNSSGNRMDLTTIGVDNGLAKAELTSVVVDPGDATKRIVRWNKVEGAEGYILERATSRDGNYELVSEIKSGDITTFVSSKQPVGSVKYYRIRAFRTVNGQREYGAYSDIICNLGKAKIVSVEVQEDDATKRVVTWDKVEGAEGYELYRAPSPTGTFELVSDIKSGDIQNFVSSKQEVGSVKYYKIRAYQTVYGERYYGEYSDLVSNGASFSIPQVQGLKVEIPEDPTKRTVTWQTIDWVDGYELERALSPSGAYELVKKIEDPNIGAFVSSKQEVGSIKYYRIRAYKVVEGVTQYGSYSEIVSNPGTSQELPVPQMQLVEVDANDATKRNIFWQPVEGVDGYELSRAETPDGVFEVVNTLEGEGRNVFVSSKQPVGSVKYYRVRAYKDVDGVRHYSEYSSLMGHVAVLEQAKLTSVTVSEEDATKRVILWEKVPYADGYELERALTPEGPYELVSNIQSGDITAFVSSKQEVGSVKYYRIRAYRITDGQTGYGPYSEIKSNPSGTISIPTPTMLLVEVPKEDYTKRNIFWQPVEGVDGYELSRAETPDGVFEVVNTLEGEDRNVFVSSKQPMGSVKYYRVRAYKVVDGIKQFGAYSNLVANDPYIIGPTLDSVVVDPNDATKRIVWWSMPSELWQNITGYVLERSESINGQYETVKVVTDPSINVFVSSKQEVGSIKYYRIRAYLEINGQTVYSDYSNVIANAPTA